MFDVFITPDPGLTNVDNSATVPTPPAASVLSTYLNSAFTSGGALTSGTCTTSSACSSTCTGTSCTSTAFCSGTSCSCWCTNSGCSGCTASGTCSSTAYNYLCGATLTAYYSQSDVGLSAVDAGTGNSASSTLSSSSYYMQIVMILVVSQIVIIIVVACVVYRRIGHSQMLKRQSNNMDITAKKSPLPQLNFHNLNANKDSEDDDTFDKNVNNPKKAFTPHTPAYTAVKSLRHKIVSLLTGRRFEQKNTVVNEQVNIDVGPPEGDNACLPGGIGSPRDETSEIPERKHTQMEDIKQTQQYPDRGQEYSVIVATAAAIKEADKLTGTYDRTQSSVSGKKGVRSGIVGAPSARVAGKTDKNRSLREMIPDGDGTRRHTSGYTTIE
jgi:hypothetical protein